MAELVDALDSGSSARKGVQVRVLSRAPIDSQRVTTTRGVEILEEDLVLCINCALVLRGPLLLLRESVALACWLTGIRIHSRYRSKALDVGVVGSVGALF